MPALGPPAPRPRRETARPAGPALRMDHASKCWRVLVNSGEHRLHQVHRRRTRAILRLRSLHSRLFSSSLAAPWPRRGDRLSWSTRFSRDQGAVATQFSNSTGTGTSPLVAQSEVVNGELAVVAAEKWEESKQWSRRVIIGLGLSLDQSRQNQPLGCRTGFWRRTGKRRAPVASRPSRGTGATGSPRSADATAASD